MLQSHDLKLLPEYKRVLRECTIGESGPGTILHDFQALLDYVKAETPLRVTAGRHQLRLRSLPEINARLAHPIQLGLQRPMQKSYPHIHGLYWLLRASGLTYVGGTKSQPVLLVDEAVERTWKALNLTERYGSLLEIWLLRANPEIIGERDWMLLNFPRNFELWASFYTQIPDEGAPVEDDALAGMPLTYYPEWHNFGVLDLFGLIRVEHGVPEEGKGWRIDRVHRTLLGDALLALLYIELFGNYDRLSVLQEEDQAPVGTLQAILHPYWPAWEQTLTLPEWTFREGVHIFKVSLGSVWWRIAIPATASLDALSTAILEAVEFGHDHLYQFTYENRFGATGRAHHPYMDEGPWATEVRVGEVPLPVGQTMFYLYDFGDQWEFEIKLERIDQEMQLDAPVVIESHGEPPEQYPKSVDWY